MTNTILLLTKYKYLILLPIAIVEGPLVSVVAGFLVSLNIFNFFLVYIIIIIGDIVGDTIFYSLGRWGGKIVIKYGHKIGVGTDKLEIAKGYFVDNHHKTLITAKLVHGIGVSGLVAAGALRVPYDRFIKTCVYISIIQSLVLTSIGFFVGGAYVKIGQYLDYYAALGSLVVMVIVLSVIFYFLWKKYKIVKSEIN